MRRLIGSPVKTLNLKENFWSGRRDSNPRHQPWQGCALPLSYARILFSKSKEEWILQNNQRIARAFFIFGGKISFFLKKQKRFFTYFRNVITSIPYWFCGYGGNGRHNRLKICWALCPCRFDSGYPHHL